MTYNIQQQDGMIALTITGASGNTATLTESVLDWRNMAQDILTIAMQELIASGKVQANGEPWEDPEIYKKESQ